MSNSEAAKGTPHIAPDGAPIAERILLPGDPLRAKFIAETYFEEVVQFNGVRNMLGYTGTFRGEQVSVMGTGMGIPSIALYTWELINVFGVRKLLRLGSIGSLQHHVKLYDLVIAQAVSTDSNFLAQYGMPGTLTPVGSFDMIRAAVDAAEAMAVDVHVGNVLSSDIYYHANPEAEAKWTDMGVLGAEMETIGLYGTATAAGAEALAIFTVSDHMLTGEDAGTEERQTSFGQMVEVGLATILSGTERARK